MSRGTEQITIVNLAHFYGTTQWYRHWSRKMLMTDGAMFLNENGAAWLIDAIASYQGTTEAKSCGGFQLWELKVDDDNSAILTCRRDSNEKPVIEQEIPFTDFPLPEISLYVEGFDPPICLLPSEH